MRQAPSSPAHRHGAGPLAARQLDFATALLDPGRSVPPGLTGPDGAPSAKRFAVYRNNVVAGLVDVLKAGFPVVERLVGPEFFAAMARIHVAQEPPGSPIMLAYGAGFPDFIDRFEPAAGLAYLGDVARLERAWIEAYHAAEAEPLAATALADIAAARTPRVKLRLHPSVRVVRSAFPVVSIWQANLAADAPPPLEIGAEGEDAIVVRPATEVEVRVLPPGAAAFVAALASGTPLVEGAMSGLAGDPRFDLGAALAGLFEAGAVTGWAIPDPHATA